MVSNSLNLDLSSFLLPDLSAFDGTTSVSKGDFKPCPPTPKRIRRTPLNVELDEYKTLLTFSDEKKRGSSFEWGTTIGVGALNEGWSVTSKETGEVSALLKSKQKLASLSERRLIVQAFKNLKKLMLADGAWHPHILCHYSLWQENGHLLLHSELCEKGDLGRLLDGKAQSCLLSESDVWEVVKQILPTLHFIHSRGVLHMDIKPANIYVTSDDIMKLGDFGTSVCREFWKEECDIHEGDAGYLAVEVLRDHYLSPAADIFSFGMTLHRLVTGYCVNTSALSDKRSFLKNPRFRISDRLSQIILSMVHPNLEVRARSEQLLSYLGLQTSPSRPLSSPLSPLPSLSPLPALSRRLSYPLLSPTSPLSPTESLSPLPVLEMQASTPLELPSPSSSSSTKSEMMVITKLDEHISSFVPFSPFTPPSCVRRIVPSPKTPTTIDARKRPRRLLPARHRSLRDL